MRWPTSRAGDGSTQRGQLAHSCPERASRAICVSHPISRHSTGPDSRRKWRTRSFMASVSSCTEKCRPIVIPANRASAQARSTARHCAQPGRGRPWLQARAWGNFCGMPSMGAAPEKGVHPGTRWAHKLVRPKIRAATAWIFTGAGADRRARCCQIRNLLDSLLQFA